MSISNEEKLNVVNNILMRLFNNVVTDEKIKKTKLNLYSKIIDFNIDKNFGWKYFLTVFIGKKKLKLSDNFIINTIEDHSCSILSVIPALIANIVITSMLFRIPAFSHSFNVVFVLTSLFFIIIANVYIYKKNKKTIKYKNMKKIEKLNFLRADMLEKFISGDLIFVDSYLKDEKVDKKQLADILKYIKSNMSEDEVFEILKSNRKDDITDLNVLYEILLKIKYRIKDKIQKEPKFTSRDIFRVMTMVDEKPIVMNKHKEEIKL